MRWLSRTDGPVTIIVYQAVGLGVLMLPPALWFWQMPSEVEVMLLIGVGVFSALAQCCNTPAVRSGDVAVISTLDYSRLLYIFVLSFVLFQTWPEPRLFFGAAIIVCAGAYAIRTRTEAASGGTFAVQCPFVWSKRQLGRPYAVMRLSSDVQGWLGRRPAGS